MDSTYVVSGGRKNIKKQPKCRQLPEIFVEHEDNLRYRHDVKHSTPYHNQSPDKKLNGVGAASANDSGFADWTSNSTFSYDESSSSPDLSVWDSFRSPVLNLKRKIQGRQSFIDEQPKFKLDAQNLIKLTLVVVVVSSICFSLFVGITINESNLNGKLRSVKYGAEKKIDALKTDGKIIDYDILDDDGNLLGGKRAAIQFAHNKNKESSEEKVADDDSKMLKSDVDTEQNRDDTPIDSAEFNKIDEEITKMKARKKILIKKLQSSNQGVPKDLKNRAKKELRSSSPKSEEPSSKKSAKNASKPPKSHAVNPLIGTVKKPNQSFPSKKKAKGETKAGSSEASVDYPDDPFR